MVRGVKLATMQSPPFLERPAGHSCPPCPWVISTLGKLGVSNHEVHSRYWSVRTEQCRWWIYMEAEFAVWPEQARVISLILHTERKGFQKYRSGTWEPAMMAMFDWTRATSFWIPLALLEQMDRPLSSSYLLACPPKSPLSHFTVGSWMDTNKRFSMRPNSAEKCRTITLFEGNSWRERATFIEGILSS